MLMLSMVVLTVILALDRLRREDHTFEVSPGYTVRPYLKEKKNMYRDQKRDTF